MTATATPTTGRWTPRRIAVWAAGALAVLWGPETYRTDILAEPGSPAATTRSEARSG